MAILRFTRVGTESSLAAPVLSSFLVGRAQADDSRADKPEHEADLRGEVVNAGFAAQIDHLRTGSDRGKHYLAATEFYARAIPRTRVNSSFPYCSWRYRHGVWCQIIRRIHIWTSCKVRIIYR